MRYDIDQFLEEHDPILIVGSDKDDRVGIKICENMDINEFATMFAYLIKTAILSIDKLKQERAELILLQKVEQILINDETIPEEENE